MVDEVSYGAVIISKGKFLVMKTPSGYFSVPKGHIEANETPVECALRECKEEVGLTHYDVIHKDVQEDIIYYEQFKISKKIGLFIIETKQTDFKPSKEAFDLRLVSKEELLSLTKPSLTHDLIKKAVIYYDSITE